MATLSPQRASRMLPGHKASTQITPTSWYVRLRKAKQRQKLTNLTLGAGDCSPLRCLQHDHSERFLRWPVRRRRLHRDRILAADDALGRDAPQASLRSQGVGRSHGQDVRRKLHPAHVHAKPAVPPARAPSGDATGTGGESTDRGRVARAARRACQRDGHLGPRRACFRVSLPPVWVRARSFNSDSDASPPQPESTALCRAILSQRPAPIRMVLHDFRLISHVRWSAPHTHSIYYECHTFSHTEGDFTLAVSAFSPTHQGAFSLLVRSSCRVEVEPIPQEGAGMFAKPVRGEWCVSNSAVSPWLIPYCCWICTQDEWCDHEVRARAAHTRPGQVCPPLFLFYIHCSP